MTDANAVERAALALLDDLLDLPESDRPRWIDAKTADPEVKARLAAMLEADRIATLRTGAAALGLSPAPLPARIGNYRITALIGRGGMGAVYRGTRDSGDFAHEAAIKVIKPGLLSGELHARFRAERQTLARFAHPHIARLHDGGEMADGSPYIVMELVEGEPIDRWADAHGLDPLARVGLVETAAHAVAHAHQRLIVHRDITPLNVLVTPDGTVKLIDFGISRPLDGAEAMTGTDIAALGRLLARLVPEPPLEIAAIIAQATASDDAGRYATAEAFAADLIAWRRREPVQAMAGGELYRLRKFVARNRLAVASLAAGLLALVAGLAVSLIALDQAQQARAAEAARFAETRAIANALLFDAFDAVSRVPGATRARETLAETATRYLDGLAAIPDAPAAVRREAGLGYVRLAAVTGGGAQSSLGRLADANDLLTKAERLLMPARTPLPADVEGAEALATLRLEQAQVDLYNNMATARARQRAAEAEAVTAPHARQSPELARLYLTALQVQGDSWGWDNDYARALPEFERALAFAANLPPAFRQSRDLLEVMGPLLRMQAEAQHKQKMPVAARASNDAAIAANRRLVAADPTDPASLRKLAQSLWYGAVVHRTNYRDAEARAAIDESVAIARRLADRDPADLGAARLLAVILEVKAQTLADARRARETAAVTAELLALHERLVAESGDSPGAIRSMTAALRTRGGDFYNLGDTAAACRMWRRALANYAALDARGELPELDRANGQPEVARLVDEVCVRGVRPTGW